MVGYVDIRFVAFSLRNYTQKDIIEIADEMAYQIKLNNQRDMLEDNTLEYSSDDFE